MTRITPTQLTKTGRQTYVTEASTIGLAPGEWPRTITLTVGAPGEMLRYERISLRGEGARYIHRHTDTTIVVLND